MPSRLTVSPPQRKPLTMTPTSSHLGSAGFWLSQSGGLPFKPSLPSSVLTGLPIAQSRSESIQLDPSSTSLSPLAPFGSRYPLFSGFHSPLSASMPPSLLPGSASRLSGLPNSLGYGCTSAFVGQMKHVSAQPIVAEQRFHDHLVSRVDIRDRVDFVSPSLAQIKILLGEVDALSVICFFFNGLPNLAKLFKLSLRQFAAFMSWNSLLVKEYLRK